MHFKIKEQVEGRRRSEYPMMQNELDESYVDVEQQQILRLWNVRVTKSVV